MKKKVAFISDVHLTEQNPYKTKNFLHWLLLQENSLDSLYILGDFFDYYLGDNCMTNLNIQIASALFGMKIKGVKVYIMHGNRDFLIGDKFCNLSGATLIKDPFFLNIFDCKIILSHGDIFCVDDVNYMKYRKIIRYPFMIFLMNNLVPNFLKNKIAIKLRQKSMKIQFYKDFVDVSEKEIAKYGTNLDLIIHGHTHKPCFYRHHHPRRIVLGEWKEKAHICILNENDYFLVEV